MLSPNEQLVESIRARQEKRTAHNGGILTADRYVRTLDDCMGHELCNRYTATKASSWDDLLKKSAQTLTYNNPDMLLEDMYGKAYQWQEPDPEGDLRTLSLPKHTLMVFKHVLTTSRRDRDGDIMRTGGAKPDPKMALLWNHVHTLPIGKMLHIAEQTENKLTVVSALIDINSLAHDSAVMIEAKMGRYSHGFKAIEFEKNKEGGGFDIKQYEIMEESLVTVPSNVDAETTDVILGLVESKKLTSPLMKEMGRSIREKKNQSVNVPIDVGGLRLDVNVTLSEKSTEEKEHGTAGNPDGAATGGSKCTGSAGCGCGCDGAGTSEKTNDDAANGEKRTDDKEVMLCPKCNERMVDGICTKCGYRGKSADGIIGEKAGRMISGRNRDTLQHAHDCVGEIQEKEYLLSKAGKALCKDAMGSIKSILDAADGSASADDTETKGGPGSGRRPGGGRKPRTREERDQILHRRRGRQILNDMRQGKPPKPQGRISRALDTIRQTLGIGDGRESGGAALGTALLGAGGLAFRRGVDDLSSATINPDATKTIIACVKLADCLLSAPSRKQCTVDDAAAYFIANADELQLQKMLTALESVQSVENRSRETQQINKLLH